MLHAFEILQANLALVASMPFGYDQVQSQVSECMSASATPEGDPHASDASMAHRQTSNDLSFDQSDPNDDCDQLQPAISACKKHSGHDQLQRGHLGADSFHKESQWKDACRTVKRDQLRRSHLGTKGLPLSSFEHHISWRILADDDDAD
eukprot:1002750-Karenia_brevis.AAC.1